MHSLVQSYNRGAIASLTIASLKMYFRNLTAVFFTFVFPIIFLVVFGFINASGSLTLDVAYYQRSDTKLAEQFDAAFQQLVRQEDDDGTGKLFRLVNEGETWSLKEAKDGLADGDLNAVIVVPKDFGRQDTGTVELYTDASDLTFGQVAGNALTSILDGLNIAANVEQFGSPPLRPYTVLQENVQSDDLDSIDYLVPGIIAFSIMSLGIFSITEGFIELKTNGSLRRLQVAPVRPGNFLIAQSITRLVMTFINVLTMLGIAVVLFNFQMRGSIVSFLVVSLLGILLFLGFGYAIAGWAKDGNQAAPISNIIFFPMMFLSGTFFPRESFPDWLQPITDYMPLTYVADGLRTIANSGATIFDVWSDVLGLVVWMVIAFMLAFRVFRWE